MANMVGILTLNGFRNYGNILQNLALQKIISELGYMPETLWYSSAGEGGFCNKVKMHVRNRDLFKTLTYQYKMRFSSEYKTMESLLHEREENFKLFCDDNISYAPFSISSATLKSEEKQEMIGERYISLFSGSDQVWGLEGANYPQMYFLPFVEQKKRNSFAASFGFAKIPDSRLLKQYQHGLSSMNNISVREIEGKNIVSDLTNKKVMVHLDPTLIFEQNDWSKVANQSQLSVNYKYILTYFLGKKSQRILSSIRQIAKKKHMRVINLNDLEDTSFFAVGPADFVKLFNNASYVYTDSFHGSVFSIIFQKRFLVFDRNDNMINMNSRINTLLTQMNLLERYVSSDATSNDITNIMDYPINFDNSLRVISNNRTQSVIFLEKAIEG